jgi:MoaA/NifB/PqqE/SkfB family radical SAM enzyme
VRLLDVILGYRCNSRCRFCSIDDALRTDNSAAAAVERQIREALRHRPRAIRFGGGEPTLWPELPALVGLARRLGLAEIGVQTNGFTLGEDDLAARLLDAGLTKLNLSLRGADARAHDALTRTRGSFARLSRGLAAVRERSPGLHVEGDVIVTRQTLPHLVDIVRGIRKLNFWYVAMEGRVRGHERELVPRLSEVTGPLEAALAAADALGLQAAQCYYVPYCFLPGRADQVWDPAGENCLVVTPRASFRLELGELDLGVKTPRCAGCRYQPRCFGVRPGYLEQFGDAEIRPVP